MKIDAYLKRNILVLSDALADELRLYETDKNTRYVIMFVSLPNMGAAYPLLMKAAGDLEKHGAKLSKTNTLTLSDIDADMLRSHGDSFVVRKEDTGFLLSGDKVEQCSLRTATSCSTGAVFNVKHDEEPELKFRSLKTYYCWDAPKYNTISKDGAGMQDSYLMYLRALIFGANLHPVDWSFSVEEHEKIKRAIQLRKNGGRVEDALPLIEKRGLRRDRAKRLLWLYKTLRHDSNEDPDTINYYVERSMYNTIASMKEAIQPYLRGRCFMFTRETTDLLYNGEACVKLEAFGSSHTYKFLIDQVSLTQDGILRVGIIKLPKGYERVPYAGSETDKCIPANTPCMRYKHIQELSVFVWALVNYFYENRHTNYPEEGFLVDATIYYTDYTCQKEGKLEAKTIHLNEDDYRKSIEDFKTSLFKQYARTTDPENLLLSRGV